MEKGWTASLFWKYQGQLTQYTVTDDAAVERSFIEAYNMADLTVSKRFWGGRSTIGAGCKNLFDVRDVQANLSGGGAHGGGGVSVPMATGRTYFLRFELDLKAK
jgi:outer membrane receptor for ferrienterochelin and colicins